MIRPPAMMPPMSTLSPKLQIRPPAMMPPMGTLSPKLQRRVSYAGDLSPSPPKASVTHEHRDAGARVRSGGAAVNRKRRRRTTWAEPPATAMRTFALSPSESASRRSLSRSIKLAVKRARSGDNELCAELLGMLPRMRDLISRADLSTYSLRELRETLETETGTDLSCHKREVRDAMQRLVCELTGGRLVAT
jgi:hypothetical protein